MASISKSPSSCSSRNRLHLQLASLLCVIVFCLLASSSALPSEYIESTSLPPQVQEDTTILPIQLEESSTPSQPSTLNATTPSHPVEDAPVDDRVDTNEAVDGGTLEQEIKYDVKSEVEDEPSPREQILENVQEALKNTDIFALSAREPKTLDTEEETKPIQDEQSEDQEKPEEPENVTDNIADSSEVVESRRRPLPAITSDLVSVIFNEEKAITEQPITKTNLLALEQEHENFELEASTPVPTFEEQKHQVTKKQGVEDPILIESPPEVNQEPAVDPVETFREDRQLGERYGHQSDDDNYIEDDEAPTKTSTSPAPIAKEEPAKSDTETANEEIEKKAEAEAKEEIEKEVAVTPSEESSVEAADSDDTQPEVEIAETPDETPTETVKLSEEEPKEEDPVQQIDLKLPAIESSSLANIVPTSTAEPQKEEDSQDVEAESVENNDKGIVEIAKAQEESSTETAKETEEEPKEEDPVQQVDNDEPAIQSSSVANHEPSSTEEPKKEEDPQKIDDESAEKNDSEEADVKATEKTETDDQSSEEDKEPVADEAKPSSDDSTATPLVSYPPHDAGQTFDSNSADEHSAQLSGPSNYRSTIIIVLCSGTAVIFIVASIVIFMVSFQRQHGTLDIEMQEQRLGKDIQDEDNVQIKLLDVDLSSPVILPMGNEETDECL
ncbi:fibrous sheath CABYR-binding protein [Drosophila ficusphila]|uniref:fibrous sheath CABYR-binding protein n=1 Tax=Drosophila ficusphila TaxID=30025 RepID=UPI0007E7F292|nr:fibrous sheath CABYR-binding protein [Drosophila ficusphila]